MLRYKGEEIAPFLGILAYHCLSSEEHVLAFEYFKKGVLHRLLENEIEEALDYVQNCSDILEHNLLPHDALQNGTVAVDLLFAHCFIHLGNFDAATYYLENAKDVSHVFACCT